MWCFTHDCCCLIVFHPSEGGAREGVQITLPLLTAVDGYGHTTSVTLVDGHDQAVVAAGRSSTRPTADRRLADNDARIAC